MVFNAGSTSGGLVFPNYRLLRKVEMQENGLYQFQWFLFDDSGCQEIYGTEAEKALGMYNPAYRSHGINGEICIQDTAIDKEKFFRIENGEMAWVDPSGLPLRGSYLSGDVLRIFRTNDGYYDVNLNTREEVKLADAQLENSYASIVLPNCIVESTLFGDQNFTPRQNEQTHAMKLFDGQTWRNVELPEELLTAGKSEFLMIYGVTSDSILLRHHLAGANLTRVEYYRIDLTAQEPALEYMGVLDLPM